MIRRINQAGLDLLKTFEGFSNVPYADIAGFQTIGYGHRILPTEVFTDVITKDYAEKLLKNDISHAEECINNQVHRDLTDNQFSALVCLAYNIGTGAFAGSTLCKLLNNHTPFVECSLQFLRWNKSGGQEVLGLTRRREAEMDLFKKA